MALNIDNIIIITKDIFERYAENDMEELGCNWPLIKFAKEDESQDRQEWDEAGLGHRVVDDVLAGSPCICSTCMLARLQTMSITRSKSHYSNF